MGGCVSGQLGSRAAGQPGSCGGAEQHRAGRAGRGSVGGGEGRRRRHLVPTTAGCRCRGSCRPGGPSRRPGPPPPPPPPSVPALAGAWFILCVPCGVRRATLAGGAWVRSQPEGLLSARACRRARAPAQCPHRQQGRPAGVCHVPACAPGARRQDARGAKNTACPGATAGVLVGFAMGRMAG